MNFLSASRTVSATLSNGWNPLYNAGTDGDYFVDWLNGSDSNNGTSVGTAFKTIQKAIDVVKLALTAKTVRIRNTAPYYEMLNFSGCYGIDILHKHKFTGYGTEKFVVRGDDIVTGWTRCTAADAATLGNTLGVNGSPVFKLRVARSSIAGATLASMGVTEDDQPVAIAQNYASLTNPHATHTDAAMHVATSYTTVPGVVGVDPTTTRIETVTKAGVLDQYTSAQITNAVLAFHAGANLTWFGTIVSLSVATVTITPLPFTYPDGTLEFGLLNILPALAPGRFGYVDVGGGNVDVYLYPTNEANLTNKIGIVSRDACMSIVACDNVIVEGFELRHMAGADNASQAGTIGFNLRVGSAGDPSQSVEVRHFKLACNVSGSALMTHMDYSVIEHYTLVDIYNRTGNTWMAVWMNYQATQRQWNKLLYGDYLRCEMSCIRLYGQQNTIVAYAKLTDCCMGSHANLFNIYFYGDHTVFWGIDSDVVGDRYGTYSASSSVTIGMCLFGGATTSDRSIDDQSNLNPPTLPTTIYVINNTTRGRLAIGSNVASGPQTTAVARNNIAAQIEQPSPRTSIQDSAYNVLLDSGLDLGAVGAFDNQFSAASVFNGSSVDLAVSSPVIGLGGQNLDTYLLALEAHHGVNLHYDARGNAFPTLDFTGALAAARGNADITAPTLSSPTASAVSSTTLSIGVTTAEARGGVYYVLTTSATPPSAAQIVAGKDNLGSTAIAAGLLTNVTAGAKSATPAGLAPATLYYVYFVHEDMHGNRSAVSSASATTSAALSGVRVLAKGSRYTPFGPSHSFASSTEIPAMLEGDVMLVIVTGANGSTSNLNPIPTGYAKLEGAAWDGAELPPSMAGASSRGTPWVFYRIAGAGGVAAHNFTFTTGSPTSFMMTYHHFRGDTPLSIVGGSGATSPALPSLPLNNGDTAFTMYSTLSGSNATPEIAANASYWGVANSPATPAGEAAWNYTGTTANHPKQMVLLKKILSTAAYSPPANYDTSIFNAFTIGLRQ